MDMIKNIPVHMDYVGQGRAEKLYQIIIVLFGVVGLFWGYTIQQFSQTVYILGAGLVLASLLTIPPWGIYRYYLTHLLREGVKQIINYLGKIFHGALTPPPPPPFRENN